MPELLFSSTFSTDNQRDVSGSGAVTVRESLEEFVRVAGVMFGRIEIVVQAGAVVAIHKHPTLARADLEEFLEQELAAAG